MPEVTLTQVLQAREARAQMQQTLLSTYGCPLICFTMNIAGPVKTSPLIERAFGVGLYALNSRLPLKQIRFQSIEITITGCQAMYLVDTDALLLKKICTAIEDETALGRLFDMDVLDTKGVRLGRDLVNGKSRDCIVCGASGRECAAGRLHSVTTLQKKTQAIISDYFVDAKPKHLAASDSEYIAALAAQSLVDEVYTTPKPGLVDRCNNGSHSDMNLSMFLESANSLRPYFQECVKIGQDSRHLSPNLTFDQLRKAGLTAEHTMYKVTGGVNTHKGAIYTIGLLCGALGRLWTPTEPIADISSILSQCAQVAFSSVIHDFSDLSSPLTAGKKLYLKYGITGVRGQAANGFPAIAHTGLRVFSNALCKGLSYNDAGVLTLLHLIAVVDDTNLYHRGGKAGADYAAHAVQTLLSTTPYPSKEQVAALDSDFIERNLSPGGCADLLAATYFLHRLTQQHYPKR